MKTLYRRIISLLLAVVVLLAFPLSALGASSSTTGSCIVEIAKGEIGGAEEGDNITKYGAWYGLQDEWCAMFVAWCANQVGIPESVIPKTASVSQMVTFYKNKNSYFHSPSQGGTAEPQVGDLYFHSDIDEEYYPSQDHIGIIVAVDSENIYTVDGNWSKKVSERTISKNDVTFVGFARPAYTSSYATLTYGSTSEGHWPICGDCGLENTADLSSHVFTSYGKSASGHWLKCSICGFGYSSDTSVHTYGSAYGYSSTYHWQICTVCGYSRGNRTAHIFETDTATGLKTCGICGYSTNVSGEFGVEEPEMLKE